MFICLHAYSFGYLLRLYSHETFWLTILRYCDKKIKRHFSTNIFFTVWIENIFFYLFETILKCNYTILKKKISFYLFIEILQYCVPKCLVWIRPYTFVCLLICLFSIRKRFGSKTVPSIRANHDLSFWAKRFIFLTNLISLIFAFLSNSLFDGFKRLLGVNPIKWMLI